MHQLSPGDIAVRGEEIYNTELRGLLEEANRGRYLALDIKSGEYEMGDAYLPLWDRLRQRNPDAIIYTLRIGYPALGRIGGRRRASR